jgi:hypothetical protein
MTPSSFRLSGSPPSLPADTTLPEPLPLHNEEAEGNQGAIGATAPVNHDPEHASLGKVVCHFLHPEHGKLTLTRQIKTQESKGVRFDLVLRNHEDKESRMAKVVYVTNEDPDHSDHSTIGYSDIEFPAAMRNKSVSYIFHLALAEACALLKLDKVAIDSVVSPMLEAACLRMGMDCGDNLDSYNASPDKMKHACSAILAGRDWYIEPVQASRTRLLPTFTEVAGKGDTKGGAHTPT